VPNRTMKSALMMAGAAAGVAAAATWLGKKQRHLAAVETPRERLIEPESTELPVGHSADPDIEYAMPRSRQPQNDTSGASLLTEDDEAPRSRDIETGLDDIWSSTPGIAEPEQSEGYDAVIPEDMGAVWIARATQTTHEDRPHASDSADIPRLEDLVSQSTIEAALPDEEDEDVISDDELDEAIERLERDEKL
jgi:hypothetical protein